MIKKSAGFLTIMILLVSGVSALELCQRATLADLQGRWGWMEAFYAPTTDEVIEMNEKYNLGVIYFKVGSGSNKGEADLKRLKEQGLVVIALAYGDGTNHVAWAKRMAVNPYVDGLAYDVEMDPKTGRINPNDRDWLGDVKTMSEAAKATGKFFLITSDMRRDLQSPEIVSAIKTYAHGAIPFYYEADVSGFSLMNSWKNSIGGKPVYPVAGSGIGYGLSSKESSKLPITLSNPPYNSKHYILWADRGTYTCAEYPGTSRCSQTDQTHQYHSGYSQKGYIAWYVYKDDYKTLLQNAAKIYKIKGKKCYTPGEPIKNTTTQQNVTNQTIEEKQCSPSSWNFIKTPEVCPSNGIRQIIWSKQENCTGGYSPENLIENENCQVTNTESSPFSIVIIGSESSYQINTENNTQIYNSTLENNNNNNSNENIILIKKTKFSETNLENLTRESLENLTNLKLENEKIRINFLESVNLSTQTEIDLDSNIIIEHNTIFINTQNIPFLNKSAEIKLKNISYLSPIILYNENLCETCQVISYSEGEFVFRVPHFSQYKIIEGLGTEYYSYEENTTEESSNETQQNIRNLNFETQTENFQEQIEDKEESNFWIILLGTIILFLIIGIGFILYKNKNFENKKQDEINKNFQYNPQEMRFQNNYPSYH